MKDPETTMKFGFQVFGPGFQDFVFFSNEICPVLDFFLLKGIVWAVGDFFM